MNHPFLASLLGVAIGLGCLCAAEASSHTPEEKTTSLAFLEGRCLKMLKMQIAVQDATKQLHQTIQANPDKKPGPRDIETATGLAAKTKALIVEVDAILDLLNKEGTAVAFTEVFEEMRGELKRVQANLEKTDTGPDTQKIQAQIAETLKDLVRAILFPR